tara:strand:- start:859 stop:2124 length:1266 start_codon:yes stop_codon:yes gene_type:complete
MDKLNYDLDNYSQNDLYDMFDIPSNETFDKTTLNNNYNKMITNVKSEIHIPEDEKGNILLFLEKAFKKLLEKDSEYKLTVGNFMPNLEKNTLFSNDKPVIKKEYKKNLTALLNPIKTKSVIKLLNINTLFRKNYYNQKSTDFIIDLPETLKNVTSITLSNTEIPNTMYSFSSEIGTNEFTIETYTDAYTDKKSTVVRIKNGNYSSTELVDYLNRFVFSKGDLKRIVCNYDTITSKISFFRDTRLAASGGVGNADNLFFNIDWRLKGKPNRSIQLNMGWLLGFRKEYYSYEEDYVDVSGVSFDKGEGFESEACFQNTNGQRYIFLSVDDYNKNFSKSLFSPFEDSAINDNNIFAKINNDKNSFDYINGDVENQFKRQYFGPVDLMKLHIKLLDEYGRVVSLNNADFSFTLRLEQLYNLNATE